MDAVKFIEERDRMCKAHYDADNEYCSAGCPGYSIECLQLDGYTEDMRKLVEIVEEWSAAHPRKTRQSVFLEQWPNAQITDGILCCPQIVEDVYHPSHGCAATRCDDCRREFWMQEVE